VRLEDVGRDPDVDDAERERDPHVALGHTISVELDPPASVPATFERRRQGAVVEIGRYARAGIERIDRFATVFRKEQRPA
jgi:hypothetical protein